MQGREKATTRWKNKASGEMMGCHGDANLHLLFRRLVQWRMAMTKRRTMDRVTAVSPSIHPFHLFPLFLRLTLPKLSHLKPHQHGLSLCHYHITDVITAAERVKHHINQYGHSQKPNQNLQSSHGEVTSCHGPESSITTTEIDN